jgi:hypothetical protein
LGCEAEGVVGLKFDHSVDALAGGVGDVGEDKCFDLRSRCLDGLSEAV